MGGAKRYPSSPGTTAMGFARSTHPTSLELICLARKYNLDARLRQNHLSGKSLKTCPALPQKYSAFVLTQIIGITPPVSRRMRALAIVTNVR